MKDLLCNRDVLGEVKNNFERFIKYLKSRKSMIKQLIDLVTDLTQQEIEEQEDLKR